MAGLIERPRTGLLRSRFRFRFRRSFLRQFIDQLLEVVLSSDGVKVHVLGHLGRVVTAGPHGFSRQVHRRVGVLLPFVGVPAAGEGVDAGEVVPLNEVTLW